MHDIEIADDDYTIEDSGELGCNYYCNQLGHYESYKELLIDIKAQMEAEQFWPSVWYINDHGNIELVLLKESLGD